jgi:hypothetical protein
VQDQPIDHNGIVLHTETPRETVTQGASEAGEHFCQVYDLISERMGRAHRSLQTRPHAEPRSSSVGSQLRATQAALSKAHTSILQLGQQLETERRAREDAEALSRAEQDTCREAMRILGETVEPLRDLKTAAAEHARQTELQARAYLELQTDRDALKTAFERAQAALSEASAETEELKVQVESEQEARAEAGQALIELQRELEQQRLAYEQQVHAYADLESRREALEAELADSAAALDASLHLAEQMKAQAESERQAREQAETRAYVERLAHEDAIRALRDCQNAGTEQRELAEEHARVRTELEASQRASEAQLVEARASLERALEAAEQSRLEAEHERRAREDAEVKARIEQEAREKAVRALRELQISVEQQKIRAEDLDYAQTQFEARRKAVDGQLKDMEEAFARAEYAAYRHAQRHSQLIADLEKERRARQDAEAKLDVERRAREEAERALRSKHPTHALLKKLLPQNR